MKAAPGGDAPAENAGPPTSASPLPGKADASVTRKQAISALFESGFDASAIKKTDNIERLEQRVEVCAPVQCTLVVYSNAHDVYTTRRLTLGIQTHGRRSSTRSRIKTSTLCDGECTTECLSGLLCMLYVLDWYLETNVTARAMSEGKLDGACNNYRHLLFRALYV